MRTCERTHMHVCAPTHMRAHAYGRPAGNCNGHSAYADDAATPISQPGCLVWRDTPRPLFGLPVPNGGWGCSEKTCLQDCFWCGTVSPSSIGGPILKRTVVLVPSEGFAQALRSAYRGHADIEIIRHRWWHRWVR